MSVAAVTWALGQWLDPAPKMVLVAIADRVNHKAGDGFGFPSLEDIAEISCQHRRTVQRHIASLEKLGLLIKEHRRADGGRQTTNLYKINMDVVITRDGEAEDAESNSQVDKLPPSSGGQIATLGGGSSATLGGGTCATPTINGKNEREDEHLPPKAPQGAKEARSVDDDEEGFNRFFDEVWVRADPRHEADPKRSAFLAWKQLTTEERAKASSPDVVAGHLLIQRRAGRTKLPGAANYLREKAFERVKAASAVAADGAPVPLGLYGRSWFCRLVEFAKGGRRTPLALKAVRMLAEAEKGRGGAVTMAELRAIEAASEDYVFVAFTSTGFDAWRQWFTDRGFVLPRPAKPGGVWMPSAMPPDEATVGQSPETQREGGR